jgi:hypothetical protein
MLLPAEGTRKEDVERAMREIARVQDPVLAGLITGLVQMQQDILLRLGVLESRLVAATAAPARPARRSVPKT